MAIIKQKIFMKLTQKPYLLCFARTKLNKIKLRGLSAAL